MPNSTKKNKVNRNRSLKNVQKKATRKQSFNVIGTRKTFPGQLIRLYATSLQNDFPGQILKEIDPKEYLKQKQKLQAQQNLNTRKYNKSKKTRGPGVRGSNAARIRNAVQRLQARLNALRRKE